MAAPARGTVLDCRCGVMTPMDFDRPIESTFDTAFLEKAFSAYPDKELRSFAIHGVATKTDAGSFMSVLGPQPTSARRHTSDTDLTRNTRAPHFTSQHWLLCHMGLY